MLVLFFPFPRYLCPCAVLLALSSLYALNQRPHFWLVAVAAFSLSSCPDQYTKAVAVIMYSILIDY